MPLNTQDWHLPGAELCGLQAPWLKTNVSGFPRAHRNAAAKRQNKTCQEAKKHQQRKGETDPFFGRGMGAHGVWYGHPGTVLSGSLRQRCTRLRRNVLKSCHDHPQEQSSGNATTPGALQGKGDLQTLNKDT